MGQFCVSQNNCCQKDKKGNEPQELHLANDIIQIRESIPFQKGQDSGRNDSHFQHMDQTNDMTRSGSTKHHSVSFQNQSKVEFKKKTDKGEIADEHHAGDAPMYDLDFHQNNMQMNQMGEVIMEDGTVALFPIEEEGMRQPQQIYYENGTMYVQQQVDDGQYFEGHPQQYSEQATNDEGVDMIEKSGDQPDITVAVDQYGNELYQARQTPMPTDEVNDLQVIEEVPMVNEYGDDISKYLFQVGSYQCDEEIDKLKKWENAQEIRNNVHFSMNGLVQYFDELLEEKNPMTNNSTSGHKWKTVCEDENEMIWSKNDQGSMTMYAQIYYPKEFLMHEIAQCLLNPKFRKQWDNLQQAFSVLPLQNDGGQNIARLYTLNKWPSPIDSKDFDEKRFVVYANDKLYCYSSSCYKLKGDKLEPLSDKDVPEGATRADSLFDLVTIERNELDGRLKLTQVSSVNLKSNSSYSILDGLVTETFKKRFIDLKAYYVANDKQIREFCSWIESTQQQVVMPQELQYNLNGFEAIECSARDPIWRDVGGIQLPQVGCMPGCTKTTCGLQECNFDYDYRKNHQNALNQRPGEFAEYNWLMANYYLLQQENQGVVCDGIKQTPINLETGLPIHEEFEDTNFAFNYARIDAKSQLKFNQKGQQYQLVMENKTPNDNFMMTQTVNLFDKSCDCAKLQGLQYHFHAPSEHSFNGKLLDLEMHIVHGLVPNSKQESKFSHGVLGFLFKAVPDDFEFSLNGQSEYHDSFLKRMLIESMSEEEAPQKSLDLTKFVSQLRYNRRWTYTGSLTTAPFSEGILWNVLEHVIPIRQSTLDLFLEYRKIEEETVFNKFQNEAEEKDVASKLSIQPDQMKPFLSEQGESFFRVAACNRVVQDQGDRPVYHIDIDP